MNWIILIAGLYLIMIFAQVTTHNFRSMLIFRLIPALLGSILVVYALMFMGIMEFLVSMAV